MNPQVRSNARPSKILTGIAHGVQQAELIGTKVLPIVEVNQSNIKVPIWPKDAFHSVDAIRTSGGTPAKTTTNTHTYETVDLEEHSLSDTVDKQEIQDGDTYKVRKRKTKVTTGKLLNSREARIEALVNDYDSYGTNNKETLTSSDQWTHADSNPREQLLDAITYGQKTLGIMFNTLTLGAESWKSLLTNAKLIEFVKNANLGLMSMETIKAVLGIKNIYVGYGVKTLADNTNDFIWGDNAVLSFTTTNRNPDKEDPSFGYTFQRKGHPLVKEAPEPHGNFTYIDVELQTAEKIISHDAAYMFKDTNA